MTIPLPTDILQAPIQDIPEFSNAFKRCCRFRGFHTLQDICQLGASDASNPQYLGTDYFSELVGFLERRKLLYAISR